MLCRTSGRSGRILLAFLMFTLFSMLSSAAFAQTLRGQLTDPDARPVAGAEVLVVRSGEIVATLTSRPDGTFGPLDLPAGEYTLLAAAPGLRAEPRRFSIGATAPATLTVPLAVSAVRESVVVSASQIDTPLSRVTDSVTVIGRAELDLQQTDTVAEALRLVPGFGVVATGGRGSLTSIFPRGGESDYTLVLIDGIPQNSFGGGFDAAHLGTADIDRIEVVRGPASALYGSGAIGGVVHVITQQGGPVRGRASFEGGGYGFNRTTASGSGSRGAWRWGGAVDRLQTDGDSRSAPSVNRSVANDDYERTIGSGSFGWSDRPARSVRVDARGDRDERGYPGAFGSDPLHLYGGLDLTSRGRNTRREVGASALFGETGAGRHRLSMTFGDLKSRFVSPPFGCNPTACRLPADVSEDRTRRLTGRYQFDRDFGRVGISMGWEALHERVDNTFITGTTFAPVPITRLVQGLFVEARPAIGARAFLTLGARLERIERSALEANPGNRPAFDSERVWSLNPKASVAWLVRAPGASGWTKVRAGVGTGIKPPTGFEIAYTDNPNLKPERNVSVDAGIEQALAGSAVIVEATFFANRYDDLIVNVGSATGVSRYRTDNVANASARGLETGVHWQAVHGLSARLAWTFLHTEVLGIDTLPSRAPGFFKVGDPLVRRPRQQGFVEVTWSGRRGNAFATIGGRGRMSDLEPNYASSVVTNPGYATVALGGAVTIARHLDVYARVLNAADRKYEEAFGYPALGRSAAVGLRVAAGR
jgi:outer membrane cobalamin receptor